MYHKNAKKHYEIRYHAHGANAVCNLQKFTSDPFFAVFQLVKFYCHYLSLPSPPLPY